MREIAWKNVISSIITRFPLLHDISVEGLTYGTSGFRSKGNLLPPVAARLSLVLALRGYYHYKRLSTQLYYSPNPIYLGLMITASHNPHDDNGFKIIDFNGESIPLSWEPFCTEIVNTMSENELSSVISSFCRKEFNAELNTLNFMDIHVFIGCDTRKTSKVITDATVEILNLVNVNNTAFFNVCTPLLHELVAQSNMNSGKFLGPETYEHKLLVNFTKLIHHTPPFGEKEKKILIVIDAANGVGTHAINNLLKHSEKHGDNILLKYFEFKLLHTDVENYESLNSQCGADFVNRHRVVSHEMIEFAKNVSNKYADVHYYFLDGDADRIVAMDYSKGEWTLMDGDRISILFATLIHKWFGAEVSNSMDIGIVQTAYANGASTSFVTEQLHLKAYMAATGVKNIHPVAQLRDIGIYFEANGHGTILFNRESVVSKLEGVETNNKEIILSLVESMSNLLSQVCGDALGNLLMCEVALRALCMKFKDLRLLYNDRPAKQVKMGVPYPKRIQVIGDETRAIAPVGFQDEVDREVEKVLSQLSKTKNPYARCFARPSGTEKIVRVYSETNTKESCDQLNKAVCEIVEKYCS